MNSVFKSKKIEILVVLLLVIIGFSLRLYASFTVPLVFDEAKKINLAKEINLAGEDLNLPLGSRVTQNPPLLPYLVRVSFLTFGENIAALRLPSVVLGSLTLLILYFLVRTYLTKEVALCCLILTTFSQFNIGSTRIAWEDGILPFFTVSVIFLIQKALHSPRRIYPILAGLTMGLGLAVKMTFLTLLPAILLYLIFYSRKKGAFRISDLLLFFLMIAVVISPFVYWNLKNDFVNYSFYAQEADFASFSLIPTALFLGELIVIGMRSFNDAIFYLIFSYEYPFLNWVMGLICLAGAIYFIRNKRNEFIVFLLLIFYSIFVFFSLVRARSGGGLYFHLDNFWWAVVAVIPGFILGSAMLVELSKRYRLFKFILAGLIIYFIGNAIIFVNFPANCFIPRNSIKEQELHSTALNYLEQGKQDQAERVFTYMQRHYYAK